MPPGDLDRRVEVLDERRDVAKLHLEDPPALAPAGHVDEPGRGLERQPRLRPRIGRMPVSRIAVTVQMVLEPDIGGYSVDSMMT